MLPSLSIGSHNWPVEAKSPHQFIRDHSSPCTYDQPIASQGLGQAFQQPGIPRWSSPHWGTNHQCPHPAHISVPVPTLTHQLSPSLPVTWLRWRILWGWLHTFGHSCPPIPCSPPEAQDMDCGEVWKIQGKPSLPWPHQAYLRCCSPSHWQWTHHAHLGFHETTPWNHWAALLKGAGIYNLTPHHPPLFDSH